jgi:tight adherence protein B
LIEPMETLIAIFLFGLLMTYVLLYYVHATSRAREHDQNLQRRLETTQTKLAETNNALRPEAKRARIELFRALEAYADQAGVRVSAIGLLLTSLALFALSSLLVSQWFGSLAGLASGTAAATMPLAFLYRRRKRRLAALSEQLPYLLDLLKSALESGHTLLRALQMSSQNLPEPMATEVRSIIERVQVGMPVPEAFETVFLRAPIEEIRFLAAAVRVQTEVGSSLAEILAHVSQSIRNRQRAEQEILARTAQSRVSAIVVGLLPVAVLIVLSLINPGYAQPLFHHPLGIRLLGVAITCDLVAALTMHHIIRIDY